MWQSGLPTMGRTESTLPTSNRGTRPNYYAGRKVQRPRDHKHFNSTIYSQRAILYEVTQKCGEVALWSRAGKGKGIPKIEWWVCTPKPGRQLIYILNVWKPK